MCPALGLGSLHMGWMGGRLAFALENERGLDQTKTQVRMQEIPGFGHERGMLMRDAGRFGHDKGLKYGRLHCNILYLVELLLSLII